MTPTPDDSGNGKLLARLDERTQWIQDALKIMQTVQGREDARMDKLETEVAVIKTKSGIIAVVSTMLTNLVAFTVLWFKFGQGGD